MTQAHPSLEALMAEEKSPETATHLEVCDACQTLISMFDAGAETPAGVASARQADTPDVEGFELLGRLAAGGMGEAWLAYDVALGRDVVLKFPRDREDGLLSERLGREAVLTAGLEHPSIVTVYQAGQDALGRPYYAMPYLEGSDLAAEIEGRSFEQRLRLLPRIVTVAHALAHAHERGVVHRDLKPDNIRLGRNAQVVVLDWGVASRRREVGEAAHAHTVGALTAFGVGTPGYMAPEQRRGEGADPRMDVYAVGATLVHLLSGEVPPPDEPAKALPAGTPAEIKTLCERATHADPAQRFPDATSLAAELERFLGGQLLVSHEYTRLQRLGRALRQRWKLVVAVLLVSSASALALALWRSARRAESEVEQLSWEKQAEFSRALASEAALLARTPAMRGTALLRAVEAVDLLVEGQFEVSPQVRGSLAEVLIAGPTSQALVAGSGMAAWGESESAFLMHQSPTGSVERFEPGELEPVARVEIGAGIVRTFRTSPDGSRTFFDHSKGAALVGWSDQSVVLLDELGSEPTPGAWLDDETLIVGTQDEVVRLDRDGVRRGSVALGAPAADAQAFEGRVMVGTTAGTVVVWDGESNPDRLEPEETTPAAIAALRSHAGGVFALHSDGMLGEVRCDESCRYSQLGRIPGDVLHLPVFGPDGSLLLVTAEQQGERPSHWYSLTSGQAPVGREWPRFASFPAAVSADSRWVADFEGDRVLAYDVGEPELAFSVRVGAPVRRVRVTPGGLIGATTEVGVVAAAVSGSPGHGGAAAHTRSVLGLRSIPTGGVLSWAADGLVLTHDSRGSRRCGRLDVAPVIAASCRPLVAASADGEIVGVPSRGVPEVPRALGVWEGQPVSIDASGVVQGLETPYPAPEGADVVGMVGDRPGEGFAAHVTDGILEVWPLERSGDASSVKVPPDFRPRAVHVGRTHVVVAGRHDSVSIARETHEALRLEGRAYAVDDSGRVVAIVFGEGAIVYGPDGSELARLPGLGETVELSWSGSRLAALDVSGALSVYDARNWRLEWVAQTRDATHVVLDAAEALLWLGHEDGRVQALPLDLDRQLEVACERLGRFKELAALASPHCGS